MALLVVRLLGWALHVETGRDTEDDTDTEDAPTVVGGDLLTPGYVEPRMGFVSPANDWTAD